MPEKSKSKTKSRKAVNALSTGIGKPKRKVTGKSELLPGTKGVKEHGGKKNTRSEEIDDLFKDLKRMDSSKEQVWYLCTQTRGKSQHIHYAYFCLQRKIEPKHDTPQPIRGSKDDIFGTEATDQRKRTEEGYVIYTEEELGFGKSGGGTDLCPFDCKCCF